MGIRWENYLTKKRLILSGFHQNNPISQEIIDHISLSGFLINKSFLLNEDWYDQDKFLFKNVTFVFKDFKVSFKRKEDKVKIHWKVNFNFLDNKSLICTILVLKNNRQADILMYQQELNSKIPIFINDKNSWNEIIDLYY